MIRVVIPGGSYAECHPSGVYAVLVGTDVIVTDGLVRHNPFGSDVPLHLRATSAGTFAGQGHESGRVIRWNGSQWIAEGTTCGVNACAFTPDGVLVVNDHCQYGTQGIRWIEPDGTIVTGDATYDGRLTEGVAEWTRHGNIVVGQSYVDGCTIHRDFDVARQLEPGHCTFVRFNRAGNKCAVALWKQLENCAVLFWFDVSEITSLKPEPTVPIDPIDPVDPDPEVKVLLPEPVFNTLKSLRPKYPTPLGDSGAALLNEVAWVHRSEGWGLESKAGGTVCPQPKTGTTCGCDILRTRELGWDVLGDAEGAGTPIRSESGPADRARFVAPVDPGGIIIDPPDDDVPQAIKDYVRNQLDDVVAENVTPIMAAVRRMAQIEMPEAVKKEVKIAVDAIVLPVPELPGDVVRESTHKGRLGFSRDIPLVKK